MNPLLEAALGYLARGWSVIPLGENKKPLIKWAAYSKVPPSAERVREWWTRWPKANVAIITGRVSGVVVVDVDPDRGGDAAKWYAEHPTERYASTPSGGHHFFYECPPEGMRNSVDKLAPGVDARGDGGFVMAPPSRRRTGATYTWDEEGSPGVLHLSNGTRPDTPAPEIQTEHWLERLLKGVSAGERNDACARLAGYYVGKRMPTEVVISQLLAWNKLNTPPLPEAEVRTTVLSVAQTARNASPLTNQEDAYSVIGLADYLSKYGATPLHWLVKDWLPEQTVGMVVAPPGSYKTWLLQDLAVSIASGLPFLGSYAVERAGPVLFMQQEDWHGQTAHRFSLIIARRAGLLLPSMSPAGVMEVDMPPHLPIYLHEDRGFRFDDRAAVDAWIEKIRRIRPALVILDPLYSAGSVEDFMAGTARDMFLFKSIRDTFGTTFLIAHHTRKSANSSAPLRGDAAPEREDVWGSQFLNAWMETGWQIRRREEIGTASIARHFKVQSDAPRSILGFHINTTVSPGRYEVTVRDVKPGEREQGADLVAILEQHGPLSMGRLSELARLHRTTIHRRLDNLVRAGVIAHRGTQYSLIGGLEVSP